MASFNIHLAVAKRYIEKNLNVLNEFDFYRGIIEPDLVKDKNISHYTGIQDKNNLLEYLSKKVELIRYLKNEYNDSDYQKGVFLHLITDYLFFNKFFDFKYISSIIYSEFCKDLYYSYDITNDYLKDKYQLDYSNFIDVMNESIVKSKKEKNVVDEVRNNILPFIELDLFIEEVSDIDLNAYKDKLISYGENIFP